MSGATNQVLVRMLDRLFAALVNGPSLNARPHASRQRVDFAQLSRLGDAGPEEALRRLLGEARQVRLAARGPAPEKRGNGFAKRGAGTSVPAASPKDAEHSKNGNGAGRSGPHVTDIERAAEKAWVEQQALLSKLRVIADDARTYEQDTGVHVLNIGFPLLSLPPGSLDARQAGSGRRVLAPIAFIPVAVTLSGGATQNVQVACRGDGIDLVVPNNALLAWLEQQTGKPTAAELFVDAQGQDPWREVCELVGHVCNLLDLDVPEVFKPAPKVEPQGGEGAGRGSAPEGGLADDGDDGPEREPAPATTTTSRNVRSTEADPAQEDAEGAVPELGAEEIEEELDAPRAAPPASRAAKDAMPQAAVGAAAPKTGWDALELQAPPRAEEDDEKPQVVPSAVLGLF